MNKLTLFNMALAHAGGSPIQSPDEEGSGTLCTSFLPIVLREALETHDYTFARKVATLTKNVENTIEDGITIATDSTLNDYNYSYAFPSDLIQLRKVKDSNSAVVATGDWCVFQSDLGTDEDGIIIEYTAALENISELPGAFSSAIAYYLAYYIATRISGIDNQRQAMLYEQYEFFITKAIASDVGREYISTQGESEFVEE